MLETTFYLKNSVQFTVMLESIIAIKNTHGAFNTLEWVGISGSEQLLNIDVNDISAITYHDITYHELVTPEINKEYRWERKSC